MRATPKRHTTHFTTYNQFTRRQRRINTGDITASCNALEVPSCGVPHGCRPSKDSPDAIVPRDKVNYDAPKDPSTHASDPPDPRGISQNAITFKTGKQIGGQFRRAAFSGPAAHQLKGKTLFKKKKKKMWKK